MLITGNSLGLESTMKHSKDASMTSLSKSKKTMSEQSLSLQEQQKPSGTLQRQSQREQAGSDKECMITLIDIQKIDIPD